MSDTWKLLTVEELKKHYETDPTVFSDAEKKMIIGLVNLVQMGLLKAFQTPNGQIAYKISEKGIEYAEEHIGIGVAG